MTGYDGLEEQRRILTSPLINVKTSWYKTGQKNAKPIEHTKTNKGLFGKFNVARNGKFIAIGARGGGRSSSSEIS